MTVILGIETSCDETAASVVVDGRDVRSSVVSSQIDLHIPYGGVVPEIAGRAHVQRLNPVVREALHQAGLSEDGRGLDLVACTIGPGLIGALLVGVSAAKALASSWSVPFYGVNHLEAHLYSPFIDEPDLELPMVTLLVSGGHTLLVVLKSPTDYQVIGGTIDDAAGEAYDKVARFLGLGYPGGPAIDRLAPTGDPTAIAFPRAMKHEGYDFSFSGLKTSVVNYVRKHPDVSTADVAASFQAAVGGRARLQGPSRSRGVRRNQHLPGWRCCSQSRPAGVDHRGVRSRRSPRASAVECYVHRQCRDGGGRRVVAHRRGRPDRAGQWGVPGLATALRRGALVVARRWRLISPSAWACRGPARRWGRWARRATCAPGGRPRPAACGSSRGGTCP